MIQLGKIVIKDKVYFKCHELEKPPSSYESGYHLGYRELKLKEYEDSKQLIEVNNETYLVKTSLNSYWILLKKKWKVTKNNQKCKAEVIKNKATIVELN